MRAKEVLRITAQVGERHGKCPLPVARNDCRVASPTTHRRGRTAFNLRPYAFLKVELMQVVSVLAAAYPSAEDIHAALVHHSHMTTALCWLLRVRNGLFCPDARFCCDMCTVLAV